MTPPITREQVRQFEMLQCRCAESLMRAVEALPDNGQGYDYFDRPPVRATLSTNPYAVWAINSYGINNADPETVEATIQFFRAHGVPAKVRVVPDGWTKEKADRLRSSGLRHVGFHTMMWRSARDLKDAGGTPTPRINIQHVTSEADFDLALKVQLEGWGVPPVPDSPLLRIRRSWRTLPDHRMYLAYLDGEPAAHAMLYADGRIGYLENASTIPRFRGKGLHSALIRRRINDAIEMGCDTIVGGADFESPSRNNQMRAGLQIGYIAALWAEVPPDHGGTAD